MVGLKRNQKLTTTGKAGALEEEQPKVGPKGEGVGTTESKDTESAEGGWDCRGRSLRWQVPGSPHSSLLECSAGVPPASVSISMSGDTPDLHGRLWYQ